MKDEKKVEIDERVREWKNRMQRPENIRERYAKMIQRFLEVIDKQTIISAEDVVMYIDKMIARGYSAYYINSTISVIRDFCRFVVAAGYQRGDASEPIRQLKSQRWYHKEPLSERQIIDLLSTVSGDTIIEKRDKAILMLMIYCGLRCNEVSMLTIGDIGIEDGVMTLALLRKGHRDKDMRIEMISQVYDAVEDYITLREFSSDEPIVISYDHRRRGKPRAIPPDSISHIVKRRLRQAGMNDKRYTAHSLRHTFATMLLRNGVPIAKVSALLGHTNTQQTMVYVKKEEQRTLISDRTIENARNFISLCQ